MTTAVADGDCFVLELADGSREVTRRVLLATGMEYRTPRIPGLAELWGRSAFHCPFCHGWEMRDQPLAVFAAGDVIAAMPQVAAAIAMGSLTAAGVVQSLLADDVGLPVPPWPATEENTHARL